MNTTTLQIPMQQQLRTRATKVARSHGFSSVQEMIRVFLKKMINKQIDIYFEPPAVRLSAKNARRYDKMIDDVELGRVRTKSFTNVEDLMKDLNS